MTGDDEGKGRGVAAAAAMGADHQQQQQQQRYGTFPGVPNYYPQPAIGFPQPVPPHGAASPPPPTSHPPYHVPIFYPHGYQAVPVYAVVAEGRPLRMPRLPCCGMGMGWFLFVIGFFLAAIPWYVGAFFLLCVRIDYREKPGFVACTTAAVIAAIAVTFGATKGVDVW